MDGGSGSGEICTTRMHGLLGRGFRRMVDEHGGVQFSMRPDA